MDTIENMRNYFAGDEFGTFVAIDALEYLNDDLLDFVVETTDYKFLNLYT